MLVGQACGTVAALVRKVQRTLARGAGGPGVLLWPYHDLAPDHPPFEAATLYRVAGIWRSDPDNVRFQPDRAVTLGEWEATVQRVPEASRRALAERVPPTRAAAVLRLADAVQFEGLPLCHP